MTHLSDILNPVALDQQVADGYIRMQRHPTLPLKVFKYAEKAVYEQAWTTEARVCRGLIVSDDGEIIGRPWPKFWSAPQHELMNDSERIPWWEPFAVYEKMDGSQGAAFPVPGGHQIATMGSFTSEQAIHATKVWNRKYEGSCIVPEDWTLIVEIIYPENRIVIPYRYDDLVLLGAVQISTGRSIGPGEAKTLLNWQGPTARMFDPAFYRNMGDSDDEEGYVLHFQQSDFRLKAKFPTYLRLHTLMTQTSSKTIWAALRDGREDELAELPDELHPFATKMADSLTRDFALIYNEARHLRWLVKEMDSRRDQAQYVLSHSPGRTVAGATFALLDGKDPSAAIWRAVEPEFTAPFGDVDAE